MENTPFFIACQFKLIKNKRVNLHHPSANVNLQKIHFQVIDINKHRIQSGMRCIS